MGYKAVIFDFDGVLNDTEGIKFNAWHKIASQFGEKISKKFFIKNCCGRSSEAISKILIKKYGIRLNPKEFAERVYTISVSLLKKEIKPIKNNIELLKKSYKMLNGMVGVASSQKRGILLFSLKKMKIKKYFKEIVAGDEIKRMKPAPDVYLRICKKLKAKPEQCIVIEDSQAGVEAACNAGIGKVIAIPREYTKYQDFLKADIVIKKQKSLERLTPYLASNQ